MGALLQPDVVEGPNVVPVVKRQHVVPKFYLSRWAVENELVVHRPGTQRTIMTSPRNAGVRGPFYRRTRPDGSKSDDFEWSLSQVEGPVSLIHRRLPHDWPLTLRDKTALAELFAIQSVRGPRYREWEAAQVREVARDMARSDLVRENPFLVERIPAAEAELGSVTVHGLRMLGVGKKLGSVLASMRWTLLTAPAANLATSDHPVVAWPIGAAKRTGQEDPFWAFAASLEIRIPLTPCTLLLATWERGPDRLEPVLMDLPMLRSANTLTIAGADKQWYSRPGALSPPTTSKPVKPLSSWLPGNHDGGRAARDPARQQTIRQLEAWRDEDQPPHHVVIVR